jgi:hypothetical protein
MSQNGVRKTVHIVTTSCEQEVQRAVGMRATMRRWRLIWYSRQCIELGILVWGANGREGVMCRIVAPID